MDQNKDESQGKPDEPEVKPLPKAKKITKSDWKKIETRLKQELQDRKQAPFRVQHEQMWKEVDRQVAMQPMTAVNRDASLADGDWHNVIELGELSKASENIASDVRRIVFPNARYWFDAHSDISTQTGLDQLPPKEKQKLQSRVDGRLRAFMMQQHQDFGLKSRVELSVKEALHHGSYVAEIRWQTQEMVHDGQKVKIRGAPVWVPHSMWNCYPDPSPSVIGVNMYYEGTMFIESYMPRYKVEQMVKSGEEGFLPSQWAKVSKDEHAIKTADGDVRTKDVKLVTYWGDVVIERPDGDLYFPNHKVILANGTAVFMNPNETPFPPIIFDGYERQDVRDPYYVSPIIKQSPMQKMGSTLANKTIDGIALKLEPPIVYDGNDPDFVLNGGPIIEPGAKVSSKGSNAFQQVQIGDPAVALQGLQFALAEMKEKLGRPGNPVGDRATKAEVVKAEQDQEAPMTGFIDKLENSLRSYLYMQHSMNVTVLKEYEFYSPEMLDPDFLRVTKKDLPKDAHFEVVGARGVLGEQERTQKMSVVTAFASANPLFAPLLDANTILLQMYQDAGVKNAERFLRTTGQPDAAQAMQQVQQLKQALQKVGGMLQQEKQKTQVKMAKIQADSQAKDAKIKSDHATKLQQIAADHDAKMQALKATLTTEMQKMLDNKTIKYEELYQKTMLAKDAQKAQQEKVKDE